MSLSMAIVIAVGVVASIPLSVVGQNQPQLSAEQQASLEEANRLNQQADELYNKGKYDAAIPLAERALAMREKVLGKEHPDVATSINNLALLYREQGNYQQAEPLYKRSLAIFEKALGQEHPLVASSINNLALLYLAQGNYQQAEPLSKRSLAIFEKALGQEHPSVATSINNLANLYRQQGNYQQAEPLSKRSLAIREKALGQEHPDVAASVNNLALLYLAQGNIAHGIDLIQRGLEIEEKNLAFIFALGSEQRKQSYINTFTHTTDTTISLALQKARNNPRATQLALTTVLRRKGRVLDAVANSVQILRSQLTNQPELKQLFDEWSSVLQQQSALVYGEKTTPQLYKDRFEQLEAQRQKLEEAISTQSAEFLNAIQPVELAAIQAKIPKDAALVEIVQYGLFNAKAKKPNEQWGAPRYAAVVVRSSGEPKWVDLGEASVINKSIASLRIALSAEGDRAGGIISKPNAQKKDVPSVQQLARTLDKQVMEPIRPLLGEAKHLIISPDGQLTLIPFEALVDEKGQYLIQRYAFSYLTTGRDLLRFQSTAKSNSSPVVFADIDYDKQQTIAATSKSTTRGGTHRRSNDLASSLRFGRLNNTQEEAQQIKAIFPTTTILSGSQATEAAIKQLSAPSILHLATHGFFLTDQQIKPKFNNFDLQTPVAFSGENPLLRSGLALAGFNNRQTVSKDADDGALTSLEVAGLDLRGTQLVVLSACETGLGDIRVGDGLYGLRRALTIAGSQSQVLSLWKVDDAGTKDLMVKYYQKLKAGKGRHEALREAQLSMLATPKYQHPNYWASFVASGDWTPLYNK
ncbi:CHAT domain-containing protein [Scytonema sp. UIC 10036]|nr:CHAT domain-containing protein [Scytonema sp. UIC 10036]